MDIENVVEMDVNIENNEENIDVDISEAGPQGLSAYEIYTKQGGTLTETEWLESLKGQNGITPNITIGTTQTLDAGSNATVQKTGTTLNPVFSFGIPQGIQGVQGKKGDTGAKGDKGDKGEKGDTGTSVLDFRVVQTLPTTDISETTIYLLRNTETTGSNLYDEYVYTNSNWEKIGDTRVDISGKLDTSKVKNIASTTAGDVYDVRYINTMIGDIESLLGGI